MALMSANCTVRTISNMYQHAPHLIMDINCKHLNRKYYMDEGNEYSKWKHVCDNNEKVIRKSWQVKELINMRDRCMNGILKRGDCNDIIALLCTL